MTMKMFSVLMMVFLLAFVPVLSGCNDELASSEETTVKDDGTLVRHKEEVSEQPDGSIVKEETKSVDTPHNDHD